LAVVEQALAVQPTESRWAEPQMTVAVEPVQSAEELHSSALSAVCLQSEHSVLEQLAAALHVAALCSAVAPAQSQPVLQLSRAQAALPPAARALASAEE